MKKVVLILVMSCCVGFIHAQSEENQNKLGFGLQVYPAGLIPTAQFIWQLNDQDAIFFRAGYNLADRKDFSPVNDNEKGGGPGGTIGYKRTWARAKGAFYGGLQMDIWQMSIDWNDDIETKSPRNGVTDITVLQPWFDVGYQLPIGSSASAIFGGLGFGREINIITKGDEVAQGWMGSLNIGILFAL